MRNLRRVERNLWIFIGGAGGYFITVSLLLAATHPTTPANELVTRSNIWLYLPVVILALKGVQISWRDWRCPYCNYPIRTMFPIPRTCQRCGGHLDF